MKCKIFSSILLLSSSIVIADQDGTTGYIQVFASKNLTQTTFSDADANQGFYFDDNQFAPQKITDALEQIPGVAYNGQGGLWQSFSIRGMSKWRVQSLIAGVPIYTERRAGNALSFIDPALLGSLQLIKGPASTYYGSGAMGGALDVLPKQFRGGEISAGYDSFGNQQAMSLGFGADDFSIGAAYRSENKDLNAAGEPLNNQFEQFSAVAQKAWSLTDELELKLVFIPTYSKDIGKSSTEYPDKRITYYPWQKHLITSVDLVKANDWGIKLFNHDQNWLSDVTRVGKRRNLVEYRSIDSGINGQKSWSAELFDWQLQGKLGIDYIRRNQVDIHERQYDLAGNLAWQRANLKGSQQESALYADAATLIADTKVQSGLRYSHYQQQATADSTSESQLTGFFATRTELNSDWHFGMQLGNGFRFPSLTEKYFSGTTGRGNVAGNLNLKPETNTNAELSLGFTEQQWSWQISLFKMWVDDYIERVQLDEESLTYRNVSSGKIRGFESIVGWYPVEGFSLRWSYQQQKGTDATDNPLADISPNEHQLELQYEQDKLTASIQYRYREHRNEQANGELALDSRDLVNISASYQLLQDWRLSVWLKNVTDAVYPYSADDLSPIAEGRHYGAQVTYQF